MATHLDVEVDRMTQPTFVTVFASSDRLSGGVTSHIAAKFTAEGVIIDLVEDGEVTKSRSLMYDELEEMLQ